MSVWNIIEATKISAWLVHKCVFGRHKSSYGFGSVQITHIDTQTRDYQSSFLKLHSKFESGLDFNS